MSFRGQPRFILVFSEEKESGGVVNVTAEGQGSNPSPDTMKISNSHFSIRTKGCTT